MWAEKARCECPESPRSWTLDQKLKGGKLSARVLPIDHELHTNLNYFVKIFDDLSIN